MIKVQFFAREVHMNSEENKLKSVIEDVEKCLAKEDMTIREHTDELLEAAEVLKNLNYIKDNTYELLKIICEYHDYGKVNLMFQKRIHSKGMRFDETKEVPHNILSTLFLEKSMFKNEDDYYCAMACIMYHHRVRENNLSEYLKKINNLIEEFKSNYYETYQKKRIRQKEIARILQTLECDRTILLKGMLHKCDYSASAQICVEYKNDFLIEKLEKLGYKWRNLQKFCIKNREENVIIVAPTGMGKTEAGLLWIGDNKGFFILPLKTAINAMYQRIAKGILKENVEHRLALLHGDMKAYYLENTNGEDIDGYIENSRQMSLPLTISTMDQLFDFVFKGYAYEYKLAQLSYSKIVIDEIQAYDETLTAFLIYGIERIHRLGGKIAVVTATLPPFVQKEIKKALDNDYIEEDFSGEGIERHNIKVVDGRINSYDIKEKFCELVDNNQSAKILVVCNSVEVAQDMYDELKRDLDEKNVKIVHSKFIKKDRNKLENMILECGKTYCDEKNKIIDKKMEIWISTSMVEASLDIDFDYLFTELNNLFSLFQRMGRCNRKGVKKIYKKEPNCYVYTQLRGKVTAYLKHTDMYECSKKALENQSGIMTEKGKEELIKVYLSEENINDYVKKYNEVKNALEIHNGDEDTKENRKIRDIASSEIIPENIYYDYKEEIENLFDKLKGNQMKSLDRIKIIEQIKKYCVNLCQYETRDRDVVFIKSISANNQIPVVKCNYDKKIGFIKNDSSSKKNEEDRLQSGGIFIE